MKIRIVSFITAIIVFSSCEKKVPCANSMTLNATSRTPTVGDNIVITALKESSNEVFQWNGPGINLTNQINTLNLDNIKLSQSGTYWCSKGNSDCNTSIGDSIVITVKLKQETPPCTLTNNYASFTNIPSFTFSSVTQSFDATFNCVSLNGYGGFGYPGITVRFNSYNGNTEPLDGTHITAEGPSFNIFQEPNEVSLSFIYGGNYFHCRSGQKVYVSHSSGKLQVSFCSMAFSAGSPLNTTCSAKMTEL